MGEKKPHPSIMAELMSLNIVGWARLSARFSYGKKNLPWWRPNQKAGAAVVGLLSEGDNQTLANSLSIPSFQERRLQNKLNTVRSLGWLKGRCQCEETSPVCESKRLFSFLAPPLHLTHLCLPCQRLNS